MTVEAAIVLPVLLCAFFSAVFLIRAVYTYGLIQHALTETAREMASSGYIYHISGIRDLHDTVRDTINDRTDVLQAQAESLLEAYNGLFGTDQAASADLPDVIETIVGFVAGRAFDEAKTQLFIPVVRQCMKKHLVTDEITDADERLRSLNVAGGLAGLDFSRSSFLSDSNEDIDIIVRYRISLPLPVKFAGDLEIVQRARARAWLGGDTKKGVLAENDDPSSEYEDIWSLGNFQRGLKIRRIFGANLPNNFPVIARYEAGRAVMIKSMDLTAASYQDARTVEKTLKGYLEELNGFQGLEKPWGRDRIVIRREDIKEKELILVIPGNKPAESVGAVLDDIVRYADSLGIRMIIEKYGYKRIEEDDAAGGTRGNAADEASDKATGKPD